MIRNDLPSPRSSAHTAFYRILWAFNITTLKDKFGKPLSPPDPDAFTNTMVSRPVQFKLALRLRRPKMAEVIEREAACAREELRAWD
jgi:hypothetical protein